MINKGIDFFLSIISIGGNSFPIIVWGNINCKGRYRKGAKRKRKNDEGVGLMALKMEPIVSALRPYYTILLLPLIKL